MDMHNISMGQILTVSAAIIMHARLTAGPDEIQACMGKLQVIDAAFARNKEHCRVFDRMVRAPLLPTCTKADERKSAQLDTFLQICNYSSTSSTIFDKNERLIQHILHYGTSYERSDYHKTGKFSVSSSCARIVGHFEILLANLPRLLELLISCKNL